MLDAINIVTTLPPHTEIDEDFTLDGEFGDITGELLVSYDERTRESGDETFLLSVDGADVVGLHIGGGFTLSRGALIAATSKAQIEQIELTLLETRRGMI